MNAAIVEFMVVTGTEWAKTVVAHRDTHRIHKKYTSSSTHTSGCFEGPVVCHWFVNLVQYNYTFLRRL